jgi:ribosome-binding protein aMBF1 (putative translation factor)
MISFHAAGHTKGGDEMAEMRFGDRIKAEREARGLTIVQLAAKVGVSTSTISRLEASTFISMWGLYHVLVALDLELVIVGDRDGIRQATKVQKG